MYLWLSLLKNTESQWKRCCTWAHLRHHMTITEGHMKAGRKTPLVSTSRILLPHKDSFFTFSRVAVTPSQALFFTNFCFEFWFSEIVSKLFYAVCLDVNSAWLNS